MWATVTVHDSKEEPVTGGIWVRRVTRYDGLGMSVLEGVIRSDGCGTVLPGDASWTGDCL